MSQSRIAIDIVMLCDGSITSDTSLSEAKTPFFSRKYNTYLFRYTKFFYLHLINSANEIRKPYFEPGFSITEFFSLLI